MPEEIIIVVEDARSFLGKYYQQLDEDDNVVVFTDVWNPKKATGSNHLPMDCEGCEFT